jgi:DNA-directed RNA polymerase subunit M/transcription elongation factor TFIIS
MGISIEQYRASIGLFRASSGGTTGEDNDNTDIKYDSCGIDSTGYKPHWRETIPWKLSASLLVCLYITMAAPFILASMPSSRLEIELLMSGIESNPGPTSITKEDDDTALAKLIDGYLEQDTKEILNSYNSTNDWDQHLKQMAKFSVAKLRSASKELKIADADKTNKTDLVKKIVKRIQFLLPEICMYCEEKYTTLPNDTPAICCYVCKHGIHMGCIETRLQANNTTEDIFKIKGVVWICSECDAAQDAQDPATTQLKHNAKSKKAVTQDEVPPVNEPAPDEVIVNEPGESEHQNAPADTQEREQDTPVCIHYKRGACRYGMSGQGCQFRHPRPCRKLLNHGNSTNGGCTKGRKCEFLHPKMCYNSLYKKACYNSECEFKHVRGTWKKEPGSHETIPRHQNAPRRYENRDNDFLEILKVLQNDMYQMNSQIQNLMRPPPPRPPNAWVNHQNQQTQQIIPTPATAFAWPQAPQC